MQSGLEAVGTRAIGDRAAVARELVLGPGEQIARDARTRLLAAAAVVLVHAAYPPGHPVQVTFPPTVKAVEGALFTVLVSFPVNAFILLSFLSLAMRLDAGAAPGHLVRAVARRLVPAHLFWAVAFLATRALATHQLPSPRTVVEGIVLGKAAAHLYFTPQLIALTASAPLWLRFARTPVRALAAGVGLGAVDLALATSWLPRLDGVGAAWGGALVGFLGLAPFALGGLALGRAWRGIAPAGDAAEKVRLYAGVVAAASAVLLVWAALEAGGDVLPPGLPIWAANNGCAVAVPLLLLAWRGRIPPAVLRLAPLTLGVYLVHPFFVQALRAGEGRVPGLAGHEALLILPNAAVAILGSFAVVRLLARTPLRRCVL